MKTNCRYCNEIITPLFEDEPYCSSMCKHKDIQRELRDEQEIDNTY